MIASFPRAGRVIVVAPHPDDEAIGAWELMRLLRQRGVAITVIVASDGGASHPESRRWPRARLVRERQRESRRAMRALGLAPAAIRFLGLADGALSAEPARLERAIGAAVRRVRRPAMIVGPTPTDAHEDHRAVARALAALPHAGALRLGYRVWPAADAPGPAHGAVPLDGTAMAIKRRIIRSYRTQAGRITDAVAGFTMTHHHLRAFVRPREAFVRLP